jgi:hypothetical protein
MMDFTPLLYVSRAMERSLLLLIRGLLLAIPVISVISTISVISMISSISCVDILIVPLLLQGPLARDSRSRAQASIHTSVTASRSATVMGFFMASSSIILMSLTPSRKTLMISMSYIYGIAFLTLQKCFRSPGCSHHASA